MHIWLNRGTRRRKYKDVEARAAWARAFKKFENLRILKIWEFWTSKNFEKF